MNLTPLILRYVFWLGWGGEDYVPAMDSTNHQNCVSNFLSNWQWPFYSQIRCIALHICKLWMVFSVPSIILVLITMQRTHPAWPLKTKLRMTLDWSRIAKEIAMMSGIFDERKLVNYRLKKDDYKQRIKQTMKHRNKQTGSKCTTHK